MRYVRRMAVALALTACSRADATSPTPAPFVPVVTTVALTPATASVTVGSTVALTVTVKDQRDSTMAGQTVTWSSSSASVATVSATGTVTGVAMGNATITATAGGKSGSAVVTVIAPATPGGGASEFQTTVPTIDLNVVLARPSASSVTVSLWSKSERDVTLTLQPDNRTVTQHVPATTLSNIELTGLAANRSYTYTVSASGGASVNGAFRTARASGATFTFDMQADSHLDSNSDPLVYANTLANIAADAPDFLIDLGDTFMTDKYSDYHNAAAQYYAQRHYLGLVGKSAPVYLVQGNHDGELGWLTASIQPWAAMMRGTYFPQPAANSFYNSALTPRNYFAWTWGDATFIVLDPYGFTTNKPTNAGSAWAWTLGKEQYDWLVSVLQKNSAPYTFVFLHNLVGGQGFEGRGGSEASVYYEWGGANADGTAGFAAQRPGWSKPIHDLLVQYKVTAMFHGHDHLYVHQDRDGIAYQEVPQPSFGREANTTSAAGYGYLSGTLLPSSGHVRVTVTPSKATVEYVRSRLTTGNGDVADRYELKPAVRP